MSSSKSLIPYHLVVLLVTLLGILGVSGTRIRYERVHNPLPRVLSMFTEVPAGYVRVVDITDGDTIVVENEGKEYTVRFLGVDTPEVKDPRKSVQCFGFQASNFTRSQLQAKAVRLESDPMEENIDAFGRLLRYIYLPDGSLFNLQMVEEGYAFAYEKYPTQKTQELKQAEDRARASNKGLWGGCSVTIKNKGKSKSTQNVDE
jgi:micrococcal nuclease